MFATIQEYQKFLFDLQNDKPPLANINFMPENPTFYNIDLNTRTIEAPQFLSVETDHRSEIVYFKVDRFFDNIDLTNTTCLIEYQNEAITQPLYSKELNETIQPGVHIYKVPIYDIHTLRQENKIIIPWLIDGAVTAKAGTVVFALKFYTATVDTQGETNPNKISEEVLIETAKLDYCLNTLPARSKIMYGITDIGQLESEYNFSADNLKQIYSKIDDSITSISQILADQASYWVEVYEDESSATQLDANWS